MPIRDWSDTAANNAANPPSGAPEGMMPSSVDDTMRQIMADVRAQWENAQFFDFGDTPTYVSATQFTVPGNLTARYAANQRITASGTGTMGTIYGTISSSAYGTLTTVTVTWDAGGLDSTLSTVAVGILSNNGMPRALFGIALSGGSATGLSGIDNTPIGQTTPAAVKATTLTSTGATSLGATSASSIDNTPIGQTTPAAGTFTQVESTQGAAFNPLKWIQSNAGVDQKNTDVLINDSFGALRAVNDAYNGDNYIIQWTRSGYTVTDVEIPAGLNNTPIGQATPAVGNFTEVHSSGYKAVKQTTFGYSTTYKAIQVAGDANVNIALGIDPATIAGGSFSGNGKEILLPNGAALLAPNSGATDWQALLSFDASGRGTLNQGMENTPIGQSTPAAGSFTTLNASSNCNVASTLRATGQAAPTSGAGVEISYSGQGYIASFDRTAGSYKVLTVSGSEITLNANGAGNPIAFNTQGATRGIFDDAGNFLVGFTASQGYGPFQVNGGAGIFGTATTYSAQPMTDNAYNCGAPSYRWANTYTYNHNFAGTLASNFGTSASGTAGDVVAARSGGTTGGYFFGNNGNNYLYYDGTNYQFGSGSGGAARINAPPGGINFGQTDLNYYEEGTFTPTLAGMTTAGAYTYYTQFGIFTRIGRAVYFEIRLEVSGTTTAASGNLLISGLPYTSNAGSSYLAAVAVAVWKGFTLASGQLCVGGDITNSSTSIHLLQSGSSNGVAALTSSSLAGNPTVYCAGHYFI